ncbi:hypothetical protein MCEL_44630 [Mycolicibacterium celeriflavum]|uniref:Uncharacterized protein n=1 Tax=Mycolicibacterium celeriflavum TaxID=1249101 RepID=A0A7I7RNL4_MYCCF|nr:hypothetical protein MCEL_44630 [Mycolicibacterium celeriflavum]
MATSSRRIPAAHTATAATNTGTMPATRKIVCIDTTFDSGPTIANDSGMNARETKKSRLETRPSIAVGTRRCSSVPQMTMPAPSVNPTTNVAAAITGNEVVKPNTMSGMAPRLHIASITER